MDINECKITNWIEMSKKTELTGKSPGKEDCSAIWEEKEEEEIVEEEEEEKEEEKEQW